MEYRIETCYHCGNKGKLDIIGEYSNVVTEDDLPNYFWEKNWLMLKCPVCGDATLLRRSTESGMYELDRNGDPVTLYDDHIYYPKNLTTFNNVPKEIREPYEAALRVVNINTDICLLSLRMVLEKICDDKKAQGSSLKLKIEDLAKNNILPLTLKDCGTFIRILGNEGAHGGSNIATYDLKEIVDFLENILIYLYELPKKIQSLNSKYTKKV